ncbi:MAG TPA: PAS domain S-box protein, partial [Burkholderiales bacterium]|nr:PAS domain S-box protein [Burkholderiales bacterium]
EQELLQKTVRDITHPDDLDSNQEFRQELLSGRSHARVYEKRYMRKDGTPIWVQIVGTLVRDKSGAPQCFVVLVHDITELKGAQDELKASESRFRRMVELSSDWYWVQDENFRFRELAGLEKRGVDPESFIGKARWELPNLGPLPDKVWQQHREKLERREPFTDFVFLAGEKSGELRYLSVTGEPVFDAQGKFTGYHGVGKDITDAAGAQKALEDSEHRYRMLFDIHPHPMWVVHNKTFAFLAVNQAAIAHYGYSREEFLSMTAEQIRLPDDIDQLLKNFQDQSRDYMQRVARHRKKNGELIDVEVTAFNLEFDGQPARLAVVDDITERLKAEERVREIERKYRALLESREDAGARRR